MALFGTERGGHGGCWCQWFRELRPDYNALGKVGRKNRLAGLIETGPPPGVMAYADELPVGWCAVSPRDDQPRLDKGRVSKRQMDTDYDSVWVITCFYVDIPWRRRGLMRPLIDGAVAFARDQGARIIEAYPMIATDRTSNADLYVGHLEAFLSCGFRHVATPLAKRAVVQLSL